MLSSPPRRGAAQQCVVLLTRVGPLLRQEKSQRLPRLAVRLVLARELGGDAGRTAQWLEQHVNRHVDPVRVPPDWPRGRRPRRSSVGLVLLAASAPECECVRSLRPGARSQVRDGVRVEVVGELLKPAIPGAVADDWQMDAWLQTLQPSPRSDASHEYSIYLLPAGRHGAFRVEDGSRRLVMGTGMAGWMLVSPDETKLMRSIEGLPKTLAGILRGEDKDVSSALVESSAAGARVSASSARFSGELEARETGQRSSLRVTLTLLVGCSADAPNASAARRQPRATPTTGNLEVEDVRSATRAAADCARGPVTWEAEQAMQGMVLPLAQRLNEIYSISLDSQVLHYADLAELAPRLHNLPHPHRPPPPLPPLPARQPAATPRSQVGALKPPGPDGGRVRRRLRPACPLPPLPPAVYLRGRAH